MIDLTTDRRVPGPALYVASDLRAFVADEAEAMALAADVRQVDADRARTYRRVDGAWWSYLVGRYGIACEQLAPLRAVLLHLVGPIAVDKAERYQLPRAYRTPEAA